MPNTLRDLPDNPRKPRPKSTPTDHFSRSYATWAILELI
jgi:hypothetical protein